MSLLIKVRDKIAQMGKSSKTADSYTQYLRMLWKLTRRVAPNATNFTDVEDRQWVTIFDLLRTEMQYAPVTISGHMCALNFAFEHIYQRPLGQIEGLVLPPRVHNVRVLPHEEEIRAIFRQLTGQPKTVLSVILGAGTRIEETCTLRVRQLDLRGGLVYIKQGKGKVDRVAKLPPSLMPKLEGWVEWRRELHVRDLEAGAGRAALPNAFERKNPRAAKDFQWQYLFPSGKVHEDGRRWYVSPRTIERKMLEARERAGVEREITPHHLRHAYAAHLKRSGVDTVDIATLLGHRSVETTKRYIHADQVETLHAPDVLKGVSI